MIAALNAHGWDVLPHWALYLRSTSIIFVLASQGIQIFVENFIKMREEKNRRQRRNTSSILSWPCHCLEYYFVTSVLTPAGAPKGADTAGTRWALLCLACTEVSLCAETWPSESTAQTQTKNKAHAHPVHGSIFFPTRKKNYRAMQCCSSSASFPKCSLRLWSLLKFSIQLPNPQLWHLWQWYLT